MANVPISICLLSELDPIIQPIQLALVKSSNKLSSFLTLTILWPLISKFSDSRWSKKSLTRCYTCKLRCQILSLKWIYDLPFSQYTQKDLESEAEGLGINLNYLTLTADHLWVNFLPVDVAIWTPKEGHWSSWISHALVWEITRTLDYLTKMINSTPVRGHLHLYNTGHDSGFPRIQLGIGHSDCCARSLSALLSVLPRKIFRPQTRKFAATAPLSSFYCLRMRWVQHSESSEFISLRPPV